MSRIPDLLRFLAAVAVLAAPVLPVLAQTPSYLDPHAVAVAAADAMDAFTAWSTLIKEEEECCRLRKEDRTQFLDQLTQYSDALARLDKAAPDAAIALAREDLARQVVSADQDSLFSPLMLKRIFRRQEPFQAALKVARDSARTQEAKAIENAQKALPTRSSEEAVADKIEKLKLRLLESQNDER